MSCVGGWRERARDLACGPGRRYVQTAANLLFGNTKQSTDYTTQTDKIQKIPPRRAHVQFWNLGGKQIPHLAGSQVGGI